MHLIGEQTINATPKGASELKLQYKMLELGASGICRDEVFHRLVSLANTESSRVNALKVLPLAIKARNAITHGAMLTLDDANALGVGHLFVKVTQMLMGYAMQHMVEQSAYYRWQNSRVGRHGFDLDD